MLLVTILTLAAYLLGSVSTAIVMSRLMRVDDPRNVGSGNPGATNMLRYAGRKAAAATLLGDALKGVIPVLVGHALGLEAPAITVVGAAAFMGHVYPVYYGFDGGKGVATIIGVSLALNPWVGLCFVATWLLMAALLRYSSLSALTATALLAPAAWLFGEPPRAVALFALMAVVVFWRHRANIANLLSGREQRIGEKRSPTQHR